MTQSTSGSAKATSIEVNDVAPISAGERHGKAWHLFTVWTTPNLEFATVFVGALAIGFGLNVWQGLLAVLLVTHSQASPTESFQRGVHQLDFLRWCFHATHSASGET